MIEKDLIFIVLSPGTELFLYLVYQNSSFLWIVNIVHGTAVALASRKMDYSAITVGYAKSISKKIFVPGQRW
jgi:hypothetical protein